MHPSDIKEIVNQIRDNLDKGEVLEPLFIHLEILFEDMKKEIELLSKTNMKLFLHSSKKALSEHKE